MVYTIPVTRKGQMTIPRDIRRAFNIHPGSFIHVSIVNEKERMVNIRPIRSIMEFSGKFKAPKGKDALKAREYMEKHYIRS